MLQNLPSLDHRLFMYKSCVCMTVCVRSSKAEEEPGNEAKCYLPQLQGDYCQLPYIAIREVSHMHTAKFILIDQCQLSIYTLCDNIITTPDIVIEHAHMPCRTVCTYRAQSLQRGHQVLGLNHKYMHSVCCACIISGTLLIVPILRGNLQKLRWSLSAAMGREGG